MSIDTYPPSNAATAGTVLGYGVLPSGGISDVTTEVDGPSVTVFVPAGRTLRISGQAQINHSGTGPTTVFGRIKEDSATLNRWVSGHVLDPEANGGFDTLFSAGSAIATPSAGVHTYKLTLQRASGSGSIAWISQAELWSFILVEDITGGTGGSGPIALGYVHKTTGSQSGITSLTDITDMTVTINVPANRTLKITGGMQIDQVTTGVPIMHIREGSTTLNRDFVNVIGGQYYKMKPVAVVHPTAGTHTYKLSLETAGGVVDAEVNASTPAFLLVEDITGTPSPGYVADSGWINATYENSWVSYGPPSYPAAAYRKIGSFVHLRGLVKSGTLPGTVFTLPLGFRPQSIRHYPTVSNNALGLIRIQTVGTVEANIGSNIWVSLAGIYFDLDAEV